MMKSWGMFVCVYVYIYMHVCGMYSLFIHVGMFKDALTKEPRINILTVQVVFQQSKR